jgi:hypothetical protein
MAKPAEFLGFRQRENVGAGVRHRWGLDESGRMTVIDVGDVVPLPPGSGKSAWEWY